MELIIVGVVVVLCASLMTALSFAPWVPTRSRDITRVLRLAALSPTDRFVELGCGDGRVLVAAAVTGAVATGVELSLPLACAAWMRIMHTRSRARVRWGSLYQFDLRNADVVYCFGIPYRLGRRFAEKLRAELSPGARVLSYAFPVSGLVPTSVDHPVGEMPIYCYTM
ncbi:MAG: hypothetical protein Q7S84_04455 [bacterium]|nr:hypothetical protein [bacterium]